jgi:hypothetical protein
MDLGLLALVPKSRGNCPKSKHFFLAASGVRGETGETDKTGETGETDKTGETDETGKTDETGGIVEMWEIGGASRQVIQSSLWV